MTDDRMTNPASQPVNLLALDAKALAAFVQELGEKPFRAKQLWQWLWQKGAAGFEEMTNLSKDFRARLGQCASVGLPIVARRAESEDGTVKLLLELADGQRVECVLIPEKDHTTLCLSTQVGCAMGCAFCSTGTMGFVRNMHWSEIAAQALVARRELGPDPALPLRNLVFMGMGEPLANTTNLLAALEVLRDPTAMDFSSRRMTVSTVGLPEGLKRLGESGLASLAVSLHAPTQELRERIMPVAARVPLPELMAALDAYPLKPRERVTYEYILLGGVNDGLAQARDLVRLLGGRKAKVNLIAYNPPGEGESPFQAPDPAQVLAFEEFLWKKDVTVTLRKSKGQDIAAACGQLRARALADDAVSRDDENPQAVV